MRMYDIGNTSGNGFWCLARDEEHAMEIALKCGHIRKASSAVIHDVTDSIDADSAASDLHALIAQERSGHLFKRIPAYSFDDFFGKLRRNEDIPSPRGNWIIRDPFENLFYDADGNSATSSAHIPFSEEKSPNPGLQIMEMTDGN